MPEPNEKLPTEPAKPMNPLKWLWLVVGVIIVVVLAILILHKSPKKPTTTATKPVVAVQITAQGFTPADLAIKTGTTVEWTNTDSAPHRVAANPYPTHTDLPGLDSKTNLGQNSTYSYQFNQTGTFHYHDEVNPSYNATITVN